MKFVSLQAPVGLPEWKQPSFDEDDRVDPVKLKKKFDESFVFYFFVIRVFGVVKSSFLLS